MDPVVATELAKCDDAIPFRAKTHYTHSTWAKTFLSRPELFLLPESLPEIEKIVKLAGRCRRRITTTGSGHSPSSLTCTSSWLVNLDRYNRVLDVDTDTGLIVVQSGIRLYQLSEELDRHGLAMPNLGSINEQSVAGAISTGTHGSSLWHGILSESIPSLRITVADGTTKSCSSEENPELFRAALLSLGALGIISEITFQAVPAFTLRWKQVIDADAKMLSRWDDDLWTHAEFVRVWWFPYTRRAVTWSAQKTTEPPSDPPAAYYEGALGYYVYHNLLYLGQWFPRILPWVEWFTFGLQYGFANGATAAAVQPSREALLMNCLYSQFVNEWAVPLHRGPEALRRLGSWLNRLGPSDPGYVAHGIPFSAEGLYVHAPVEVRVSDASALRSTPTLAPPPRAYLDPTVEDGPTLYLNATLYRPYHTDPACRARYYEAFEWLMRELGGRPHWAKNFETDGPAIERMYGPDLEAWRSVRAQADPDGMFVGPWHRRHVLGQDGPILPLEEVEVKRARLSSLFSGGGVLVNSDYDPIPDPPLGSIGSFFARLRGKLGWGGHAAAAAAAAPAATTTTTATSDRDEKGHVGA
ncbi:D-arabinono-1,4-lactone oxidase [Diatrype stigma]|uniref:D-arabinono-1,4-lactone oxidase n=1 Tax=Diatrype stigma TaxID=117547 RepID=A0AAN9UWD4_9PEZI